MSFNYLLNSTDKIKEKPFDIISRMDPKKIEQAFKNKKNIFKNTENNNKKSESFKYKKNLMILEKSYQDSLILLDILKKNREKNILEKYDIENIVSLAKNNDTIKKILMKKKISDNSSLSFPESKLDLSKKKIFDFNIIEITEDILETIKNTVIKTYETVKTETIKLFNGTTIKKILFSDNNTSSDEESIVSLEKHVEELKRTIESSKVFMRAIIDKIRYQGKIKIINELNNNPKHPEYQSSFPDLFTFTPKPNNSNNFYPFNRLDEDFDLEGRKSILQTDRNFKKRMNKSVQESYYNNFINNESWEVSDRLNSLKNIKYTIENFQRQYEYSKFSKELDKKFMNDSNPSLFIINDHLIPLDNRIKMIEDFKKIIPNVKFQKLISTYANQKFLYQSYLQLVSENPEINEYQIKNSRNIYKIDNLNDGSIKLVATNLSDLNIKNKNYIPKYKSFGIRATIVIPPNDLPIMKYSHFVKK